MDRELTQVERRVLRALMDPEARPADQTVEAIVERTKLDEADVRTALVKLEAEGAVHPYVDLGLGAEFWMALDEAAERLEPPA